MPFSSFDGAKTNRNPFGNDSTWHLLVYNNTPPTAIEKKGVTIQHSYKKIDAGHPPFTNAHKMKTYCLPQKAVVGEGTFFFFLLYHPYAIACV